MLVALFGGVPCSAGPVLGVSASSWLGGICPAKNVSDPIAVQLSDYCPSLSDSAVSAWASLPMGELFARGAPQGQAQASLSEIITFHSSGNPVLTHQLFTLTLTGQFGNTCPQSDTPGMCQLGSAWFDVTNPGTNHKDSVSNWYAADFTPNYIPITIADGTQLLIEARVQGDLGGGTFNITVNPPPGFTWTSQSGVFAIPEPSSLVLTALGVIALAVAGRR